jgi:hypothetical protein
VYDDEVVPVVEFADEELLVLDAGTVDVAVEPEFDATAAPVAPVVV